MWNLPNLLTLSRILMIPVFVALFYLSVSWNHKAAALVFMAAAFTDWLDGYLARRMGLVSPLGAFLDPVADKLMVATALVLVVADNPQVWLAVSAAVIIGREITISALREWMAELGNRAKVAVSWVGKFKTAAQMTAITLLIYRHDLLGLPVYKAGTWLLYIAVVLTLWSMTVYLIAAWPLLSGREKTSSSPEVS
ncbi:MAG: CDP-diacylglycerol--glycerol-3-phosphate 3-phosphatidyltransferase [Gammaproteobacteria bacterium]|nr:MAG: CDP-diacylglycerol--glycerol-3-phosphate 3-phosphatidyltransferase [Gammaproteobacteria bacterium]RTZ76595.1 MAG: CDP-diacylglycerol--glycerol-3-phosphate 3-phosphatidyltransferase [Gammaproteobacteria bacterium]